MFALALAWWGYFSPWFSPIPVGLRLSAHDLVEWLTFVQTVRDGTFPVSRIDLLIPLVGIAFETALTPAFYRSVEPPVRNLVGIGSLGLALFTALLILPAYPFVLSAYHDAELAPQFWLGIAAAAAALAAAGLAWFQPRWALALTLGVGLLTLGTSWRAYNLAGPPLADVLTKPPPAGYGIQSCVVGLILLTIAAALELLTLNRQDGRMPGR